MKKYIVILFSVLTILISEDKTYEFTEDEVKVVQEEQRLTISGNNSTKEEEENILHKGIASRAFTKTFDLAENIEVTEASFTNGMVIIKLKRNIPEDKMPRLIEFT